MRLPTNPTNPTSRRTSSGAKLFRVLRIASVLALGGPLTGSAADWYLHREMPFGLNWNTVAEWWSLPEGGTQPTAINSADNYITNGCTILTPQNNVAQTFGGASLTLCGATINVRANTGSPGVTIGNLISKTGKIVNGYGGSQIVKVTNFQNHGSTTIHTEGALRSLNVQIGNLTGSGDLNLMGGGNLTLTVTSANAFYGRMVAGSAYWNSSTMQVEPTKLVFQNAVVSRGALVVESGAQITLNANVQFCGLVVGGVSQPPATYPASAFGFAGTGTISNVAAVPWHLQSNNAIGTSWNTLSNWWSAPTAGANPTAINGNDDYFSTGFELRTPATTVNETFGGASLTLNGGNIGVKAGSSIVTTAIPNLSTVGVGGTIQNSVDGIRIVKVTDLWNNGASLTLDAVASNRGLNLLVDNLHGAGNLILMGRSGGTFQLNVNDANHFTGTLTMSATSPGTLTFQTPWFSAGPMVVPAGNSVVLNKPVTVTGLTVNGTVIAAGTYTAALLGSQFSGASTLTVKNRPPQMFGVNLAGLEFGAQSLRPTDNSLVYYKGKNLNLFRVPFSWERVIDANGNLITGSLSTLAHLDTLLAKANSIGAKVILDMHNYGAYNKNQIGSAGAPYAFYQSSWTKLAAHFNASPNASAIYAYDIMNEPQHSTLNWPVAAQYGVNGVRAADTTRFIMIEGKTWSAAISWPRHNVGLLAVTDPYKKLIYSAHCYFANANNDGYVSYDREGAHPNKAIELVAPFVEWCRINNVFGHIGEFGVPKDDPRWNEVLRNFLQYCSDNDISTSYWYGGGRAVYHLGCDPSQFTNPINPAYDSPPMQVLELFHQ